MTDILRVPDLVEVQTEEEKSSGNAVVTFNRTSYGFQVYCQSQEERVRFLTLHWDGRFPEGTRILGDAWERGYGDLQWKELTEAGSLPWYFMASAQGVHMGFGVMTQASAMCAWQADETGITLRLDVRCGGTGVALKGRRLHAATLVSGEYRDMSAFEALSSFCKKMCGYALSTREPVYGCNNWYYAYGKSSEQDILADADGMAELSEGLKVRPYVVIDDGWQSDHVPEQYNGGPWRRGNAAFPDMKGLAGKIRSKNLKAGIWFRPLLNAQAPVPPEARLSHDQALDPSHPEVQKLIAEDVKTICEWGYSLIKHDFTTFDIFGRWGFEMDSFPAADGWHFFDETKTSAEIIMGLYQTIREAAAPYRTLIMGCNAMGHLGTGLMHMQRIGDDTSGKNWDITRKMGVNSLAFRLAQDHAFFRVDADCVGITEAIPWEKNRQFARLLAYSGTPLFVSLKPGVLTEEQKKELREIFRTAVSRTSLEPLDWMEELCPQLWKTDGCTVRFEW